MDKKIKNVVFDVGMVLIDFCWEECCKRLEFSEEIIHAFDVNMIQSEYWDMLDEGTITTKGAIDKFIAAMPQYEKEIRLFWEHAQWFVKEYDFATPMIKELQKDGYKVYLLSNYPYDMYKLHWPTFSFFELVDGYVVSAVEKLKKPDPSIYKCLLNRFELNASECLFIDDREVNVKAAQKVGMQAKQFIDYKDLTDFLRRNIS